MFDKIRMSTGVPLMGSRSPFKRCLNKIVYVCSNGYYLPANYDGCVVCPANSYCAGGTYTFNETTTQGITGVCGNGYSAPAGSSSVSDCVGNQITINWTGTTQAAIDANDVGMCTYGGDIRTPQSATHVPGKIFTGWIFVAPSGE